MLERERARRKGLERPPDPTSPADPPIASWWRRATSARARIREAIERAELPYAEVSAEVDRFVRAMESTAVRAQLLYEALADTPPPVVARAPASRCEGDPARAELAARARAASTRCWRGWRRQLQRFYDRDGAGAGGARHRARQPRVGVSVDEAANQQRLAAEVRGLREEVGALAEGMSEAYEGPAKAGPS